MFFFYSICDAIERFMEDIQLLIHSYDIFTTILEKCYHKHANYEVTLMEVWDNYALLA